MSRSPLHRGTPLARLHSKSNLHVAPDCVLSSSTTSHELKPTMPYPWCIEYSKSRLGLVQQPLESSVS